MIDRSEKRNRQLAFELQNSHVCEKRSKVMTCVCFFKSKRLHLHLSFVFNAEKTRMR